MASCCSCFTASFHYHFDNFTFARSERSLKSRNSRRNSHPRLQSLYLISFASLASHLTRHKHKDKRVTDPRHSGDDFNGRGRQHRKPHLVTTKSNSPVPRFLAKRAAAEESPITKSDFEQNFTHSKPHKDPVRHVSFARSPSFRSASELCFLLIPSFPVALFSQYEPLP